MNDLVRQFAIDLAAERGWSETTVRSYVGDLNDLLCYLAVRGIDRPEAVRPHHLSMYIHQLRQMGRSEATIIRRLSAARAFFAYLRGRGLIVDNPVAQVASPRAGKGRLRSLSVEEVERLLAAPSPDTPLGMRDRAMLGLMYASGLKASELLQLDVDDVRLDMALVRCAAPGKKERLVPVDPVCVRTLRTYLSESRPLLARPDVRALFVNRSGERMTRQALWKTLKKYAAAVGVDPDAIGPQTLRHSFAVHLLHNGADLRAVQDLLGHAHLSTTQMYASVARPRIRDVYERAHPRASRNKTPGDRSPDDRSPDARSPDGRSPEDRSPDTGTLTPRS